MTPEDHIHTAVCLDEGCALLTMPIALAPARTSRLARLTTWATQPPTSTRLLIVACMAAAMIVPAALSGNGAGPVSSPAAAADAPDTQVPAAPPNSGDLNGAQQRAVEVLASKPVPNLQGLALPRALEALLKVGLKPDTFDATGQGRTPLVLTRWTVVGQSPAAGTMRAPGTEVRVCVVKAGEPVSGCS